MFNCKCGKEMIRLPAEGISKSGVFYSCMSCGMIMVPDFNVEEIEGIWHVPVDMNADFTTGWTSTSG